MRRRKITMIRLILAGSLGNARLAVVRLQQGETEPFDKASA